MAQTAERTPPGRLETRTPRLRLVAIDPELARLQAEDPRGFFDALGAEREAAWPPVAADARKIAEKFAILSERPQETGWRGWVFLMGWTPGGRDKAVGAGGFFGPPDAAGEVEIGYAMSPSFREQGLATEAVQGLLDWALGQPGVKAVRARTLAHLLASRRVLEKTGFVPVGEETDADGAVVALYRREA